MNRAFDDWTIEFHSGIPAYKQVIHQVQAAILLGHLGEGDQLPTMRELHLKLGINPNTVAKAYRELEAAGSIVTAQGSGCFVAPAAKVPKLSVKEKQAKLGELVARFVGEAKSHGIQLEELRKHLNNIDNVNTRKSYV